MGERFALSPKRTQCQSCGIVPELVMRHRLSMSDLILQDLQSKYRRGWQNHDAFLQPGTPSSMTSLICTRTIIFNSPSFLFQTLSLLFNDTSKGLTCPLTLNWLSDFPKAWYRWWSQVNFRSIVKSSENLREKKVQHCSRCCYNLLSTKDTRTAMWWCKVYLCLLLLIKQCQERYWDDMYLNLRCPIPVHGNPAYNLKQDQDCGKQKSQASRLSKFISLSFRWQEKVLRGHLEPEKSPSCMSFFSRSVLLRFLRGPSSLRVIQTTWNSTNSTHG